jgi:hypothetical protein
MIERDSMTVVLEKVIYKPEGATRKKSVVLKNPRMVEIVGNPAVVGVNFQNQSQTHIIQESLITERFEVEQDKMYGGFKNKSK